MIWIWSPSPQALVLGKDWKLQAEGPCWGRMSLGLDCWDNIVPSGILPLCLHPVCCEVREFICYMFVPSRCQVTADRILWNWEPKQVRPSSDCSVTTFATATREAIGTTASFVEGQAVSKGIWAKAPLGSKCSPQKAHNHRHMRMMTYQTVHIQIWKFYTVMLGSLACF